LIAEIYALSTAFLRGFSAITTKRGLQASNPNTSVIVTVIINTLILWAVSLFLYPMSLASFQGFQYFVIAGFFAPGIAKIFMDTGLQRVGVAITTPIVSSNTLFSTIMAVLLLGEKITIYLGIGAVLIFIGAIILTHKGQSPVAWNRRDLLLPFTAAVLFALSVNVRKLGLNIMEYPILGAAITSTASLTMLLLYLLYLNLSRGTRLFYFERRSMFYFTVTGFFQAIAFILYFLAISSSLVVRVQPIAATNPLFAILFTVLFMRDEEEITGKIILGGLVMIVGMMLLFI
jgi:uncharacterized membrane protein